LALFVLALGLRLPYLYLVPTWADDVNESLYALRIAQGVHNPLIGMVEYTGPIHASLLGLVLFVYQDPLVPRAFNAVLAALTIPAIYYLGSSLHNRAAGILAGLLLATASTHIVVNSHYSYSSAATPLFSTLACATLLTAQKRNSVLFLGAAGVCLALAMQTHPVAVAIAPGMVFWFWSVREHWTWFRRPALYIAGLVTFAAYAPVIFAVGKNPGGLEVAVGTRSYALQTNPSIGTYLGNLQNLVVELLRMVSAHYHGESRPLIYLTDPLALVCAVLVPAAVVAAVRHGRTLPVFVLASSALIIPYFLYQYDLFPYFTRYVAFMLPLIYVLIGSLAVESWGWVSRQRFLGTRTGQYAARIAIVVVMAALIVLPVQRTFQYYSGRVRSGATNAPFFEIMAKLDEERTVPVGIDESLLAGEFVGGGDLYTAFRNWFRFQERTFGRTALMKNPRGDMCAGGRLFVVAATSAMAKLPKECSMITVLEYNIQTRPGRPRLDYGLYEIAPNTSSRPR
jgi:hypothetical protein